MDIPRRLSSCGRFITLMLVTSASFATGPGGFRGNLRPPPWHAGVAFGGPRLYGGPVRALPRGAMAFHHRGAPWFFGAGFWYRPWGYGYARGYPPTGLWISALPLGFATYWSSGIPYYGYGDVYYHDAPSGGYVVAEPPPGWEDDRNLTQPKAGSPDAAALDALLIIPKEGQSPETMERDRRKAQEYAQTKSGYDPAYSDPADPGTPRARQAYLRAMRSYLEERGYSVK